MAGATTTFTTKSKVEAASDLAGVPEGTAGKILLVNGFSWTRYFVTFDNGVSIGSLDGRFLRPRRA